MLFFLVSIPQSPGRYNVREMHVITNIACRNLRGCWVNRFLFVFQALLCPLAMLIGFRSRLSSQSLFFCADFQKPWCIVVDGHTWMEVLPTSRKVISGRVPMSHQLLWTIFLHFVCSSQKFLGTWAIKDRLHFTCFSNVFTAFYLQIRTELFSYESCSSSLWLFECCVECLNSSPAFLVSVSGA